MLELYMIWECKSQMMEQQDRKGLSVWKSRSSLAISELIISRFGLQEKKEIFILFQQFIFNFILHANDPILVHIWNTLLDLNHFPYALFVIKRIFISL